MISRRMYFKNIHPQLDDVSYYLLSTTFYPSLDIQVYLNYEWGIKFEKNRQILLIYDSSA